MEVRFVEVELKAIYAAELLIAQLSLAAFAVAVVFELSREIEVVCASPIVDERRQRKNVR